MEQLTITTMIQKETPKKKLFQKRRFRFYSSVNEKGYRIAIEINSYLDGIPNVNTNILITLFKEDRYLLEINKIKKGDFNNLSLLYEIEDGWTALVTHSSAGVFDAVATASREDNTSNFNHNISRKNK